MAVAGELCLFAHSNALLVSHVCNVLEAAGIACELRNMSLGGGAGELPLSECEPEVWVAACDYTHAQLLLQAALHGPDDMPSAWRCQQCGEMLDGVFDTCWQCGTPRDME
ncbi:DUF2007 domain-containing protein [Halomonas sp. McH1-25]|uniref:putative signal transducing protein n=1 Tax=unclassified Halomonas TaxID=2609666 RepID=UPI001EF5D096|nr:DUF2007 domain-containing protein [Halomonas sp. McH1-25]MCP1342211.1 DUF2007 domain-containing protein [Halomonas sp. FL8]MCP1360572.1 DUF2007 domain-containing protein [Halomonas sp. BBD45]